MLFTFLQKQCTATYVHSDFIFCNHDEFDSLIICINTSNYSHAVGIA